MAARDVAASRGTPAAEAGAMDMALCSTVSQLSLEEARPAAGSSSRLGVAAKRLSWYDQMLPFVKRREGAMLDWKAWANCGACLYQLGERKASRDSYKQAALARCGYERDLTDAELHASPEVGQFLRQLDREFLLDGWAAEEADDLALFTLLVRQGRSSEIATQCWHEVLPNHYFSVMRALCRKLSSPSQLLRQACPDDSRPDFQRANFLALLATPGAFFVERHAAKRAKLEPCVRDVCIELYCIGDTSANDFEVREVEQPDD